MENQKKSKPIKVPVGRPRIRGKTEAVNIRFDVDFLQEFRTFCKDTNQSQWRVAQRGIRMVMDEES